ncbi:MAG: transcriptional regulator NrdR [Verrucomicrobium sp.]|nr:transcriptional regulator NrdR [Verrucomicrobium sp.]
MRCPKCGTLEDKVIDSREAKDGSSVRRRRECQGCNHRFTTYEQVEHEELRVIKRNESRQPFSREKLIDSMKKACGKRPVGIELLEHATDAIITELTALGYREVPSRVLGVKVMQHLEAIDHISYVRYASIYREFQELGEFINEINSLETRVPRDVKQPDLFRKA